MPKDNPPNLLPTARNQCFAIAAQFHDGKLPEDQAIKQMVALGMPKVLAEELLTTSDVIVK
jgi:hypothetical protein